jgi:hypothetical protein
MCREPRRSCTLQCTEVDEGWCADSNDDDTHTRVQVQSIDQLSEPRWTGTGTGEPSRTGRAARVKVESAQCKVVSFPLPSRHLEDRALNHSDRSKHRCSETHAHIALSGMNPATERLLPAQSPSPPSVEWQHSMISDVPERPYPTYDELSYDDYLVRARARTSMPQAGDPEQESSLT